MPKRKVVTDFMRRIFFCASGEKASMRPPNPISPNHSRASPSINYPHGSLCRNQHLLSFLRRTTCLSFAHPLMSPWLVKVTCGLRPLSKIPATCDESGTQLGSVQLTLVPKCVRGLYTHQNHSLMPTRRGETDIGLRAHPMPGCCWA